MNPLEPIGALLKAVIFPIRAVIVVGLCYFINVVTSPGHWWAQWVAFGMAIATIAVWLRALRVLLEAAGIAGIGYLAYRWWRGRRPGGLDGRTFENGAT